MRALTFSIKPLEPLLAAQISAGDPNSASSFDFIPGSMLRGALIGRYIKKRIPNGKVDASDSLFRKLFFNKDVCFLNAYPQSRDGSRTLPTPLSWFVEKDTSEPVFDFSVELGPDKIWKNVGCPFCHILDSTGSDPCVTFHEPRRQLNIHIDRGDRKYLNRPEESNVFRYQALAPGEKYACSVVLGDDLSPSDFEEIKTVLEELVFNSICYNLGGSHTAGYGRVEFCDVHWSDDDWSEYKLLEDDTDLMVVTLLSDTIIRDNETGNWVADLDPALGHYGLKNLRAYKRTRIVGGFNRTWNLPLTQTMAIQAGSVFVYKCKDADLREKVFELVNKGVGERRSEGFGRLAINWHRAKVIKVKKENKQKPLPYLLDKSDKDACSLAARMVERMLRVDLDEHLIHLINHIRFTSNLSRSQIGRLRSLLRQVMKDKDTKPLCDHLDHLKTAARDQFDSSKVRVSIMEQLLTTWLKNLAENPKEVWDLLKIESRDLPSIGGVKPNLSPELTLEYVARLIDGVLAMAAKEEKQSAES